MKAECCVWCIETGELVLSTPCPAGRTVQSIAVANGRLYTGYSSGECDVWNAASEDAVDDLFVRTLRPPTTWATSWCMSIAVGCGHVFLGLYDRVCYVFDEETGAFIDRRLTGHTDMITKVVVAGEYVYTLSTDCTCTVWNAVRLAPVRIMFFNRGRTALHDVVVEDGVLYLATENGQVYTYDADTGDALGRVLVSTRPLKSIAVSGGHVFAAELSKDFAHAVPVNPERVPNEFSLTAQKNSVTSICARGGRVFVADESGNVSMYRPGTEEDYAVRMGIFDGRFVVADVGELAEPERVDAASDLAYDVSRVYCDGAGDSTLAECLRSLPAELVLMVLQFAV
jgi:WD40 repeat protein